MKKMVLREGWLLKRFPTGMDYSPEELEAGFRVPGTGKDRSFPVLNFPELANGGYALDVQVLDANNPAGETATWHFRILPKWSQTWWAFLFYFSTFVIFVVAVVRVSQRRY